MWTQNSDFTFTLGGGQTGDDSVEAILDKLSDEMREAVVSFVRGNIKDISETRENVYHLDTFDFQELTCESLPEYIQISMMKMLEIVALAIDTNFDEIERYTFENPL